MWMIGIALARRSVLVQLMKMILRILKSWDLIKIVLRGCLQLERFRALRF